MAQARIGFGGGGHWCTEAYFRSLKGVESVEQGWISAASPNNEFSEAVIVYYDLPVIFLKVLIAIHLHTHTATKKHALREKYQLAVYSFYGKIEQSKNLLQNTRLTLAKR